MINNPSVSVIIPVYNCRDYLAEAIESVLAQTLKPAEIIVVDDGSSDGSADVAKQFLPDIQYYFQSNAGTGAARNKGIKMARGDCFSFLDADDYWLAGKLSAQSAVLRDNPSIDAVFGHVQQFQSPELDTSEKKIQCPDTSMPGYLPSAMMIKKEAFFRVGLFETNWKVGQDVSWILRAKEEGLHMAMLPDLLYMRRLHKSNKGITHRKYMIDRVRILKASLDRRRKIPLQDKNNADENNEHYK